MNWKYHAPLQWKIGTLKNLVKRSIVICSGQLLLQIELDHLRMVFVEIYDYPSKTIGNIFLPFSGKQGIQLLSKMKKQLKKRIPSNVKTCIAYKGTKLSTRFR